MRWFHVVILFGSSFRRHLSNDLPVDWAAPHPDPANPL
ncbi:hypothetical protein GZL_00713 [Streptomyces sp. 769]|nr:hypothetical protein GZL_00713 [Streptomyces sp. 769]